MYTMSATRLVPLSFSANVAEESIADFLGGLPPLSGELLPLAVKIEIPADNGTEPDSLLSSNAPSPSAFFRSPIPTESSDMLSAPAMTAGFFQLSDSDSASASSPESSSSSLPVKVEPLNLASDSLDSHDAAEKKATPKADGASSFSYNKRKADIASGRRKRQKMAFNIQEIILEEAHQKLERLQRLSPNPPERKSLSTHSRLLPILESHARCFSEFASMHPSILSESGVTRPRELSFAIDAEKQTLLQESIDAVRLAHRIVAPDHPSKQERLITERSAKRTFVGIEVLDQIRNRQLNPDDPKTEKRLAHKWRDLKIPQVPLSNASSPALFSSSARQTRSAAALKRNSKMTPVVKISI